jgi:hypothetical protein
MSTLTLLKATAYVLKYRLDSDGTDVTRTQAQLIADAATASQSATSNIRKLLTANIDTNPPVAWTDAQWAALTSRKDFSIYTSLRTATGGAVLKAIVPGTRLLVVSPCAAGEAEIELRFIHSVVQ